MSKQKLTYIEAVTILPLEYDGQRYDIPSGKTLIGSAFVSHLGKTADADLAKVLATHAVSKYGSIVVDGETVSKVRIVVEYGPEIADPPSVEERLTALEAKVAALSAPTVAEAPPAQEPAQEPQG